ncbi:unnamed protein product [Candidula unifasciata]|uniref:Iron-sulfur cluster assembly 1 homolog, mitochondrial n=1 Tax=Candidula unifasciata TaxID=100452 RepID=A0A8S3YPL3_9EUPU|nr:unnamed protein product [Candidula unifasciata]
MASRAIGRATVRAVTSKRLTPQKAPLTLTTNAVKKLKQLMADRPDMHGVLIGVKTRGCNGLTYTLDYADKKGKFDGEVVQDGVKVFIDAKAQLTLLGTEMDYHEDKLTSEFIFNNPNIKGTCGCGESFNV